MKFIPSMLLKQLYTRGSLKNTTSGVEFIMKNRLSDVEVFSVSGLQIGDHKIPNSAVTLDLGSGETLRPDSISKENPFDFPLRKTFAVIVDMPALPEGKYTISVDFRTRKYGTLSLKVDGAISKEGVQQNKIPRDEMDDYGADSILARQKYIKEQTNFEINHSKKYSFDPHVVEGNCEHFVGVSQIPLGIAGPVKINGEFADGEFLIPMATTEGTLVASYNRGMKIINLSGGVTTTIQDDAMQRAPVFVFEDARGARDFVLWIKQNFETIKEKAEETTSIGKLKYIDPFLSNKFAFLRFNYLTGDAAGQNMVGKATFAACSWILDHYKSYPVSNFYLESNLATDKKASQVNIMRTRGKRVTAEIVIPKEVLHQHMRVEPEKLAYHNQVANIGAILSGANNNGLHSANGITAMFIATGQDVANVAESSAGLFHSELTSNGDFYMSITIPSLIVATYGGGTGLPTQRECLEMLGCSGTDKVMKFAEIVAGVVLAGEISLGAAISSSDWVSSHEHFGRNR